MKRFAKNGCSVCHGTLVRTQMGSKWLCRKCNEYRGYSE